ncbi:hypothetical protein Bpfe_000101 [Biomphalaria pfeifferi]|uniref:Endonuclease/exonuclease/phosphatase domain-containing protein n=1 Tax=Biomphalaria pfeifferi TaxID=112525 RepID=A0AAD8CCZ5_BIOPF|nr:hypothetical protein Bpfe_000101 [Biomphalaria pfeifferi]
MKQTHLLEVPGIRNVCEKYANGLCSGIQRPCGPGETDTLTVEVYKYVQRFTCSPPKSELQFKLREPFGTKLIVAGDFSAKSPSWGCQETDIRGRRLLEICDQTNLVVLSAKGIR